ncbi:MAG: exopolysaccharide biosynthesis protein [Xanthomonadaceae bacterium]|nr:exopolysaccharide biosynthesis protein [Xanthomonadaceae bacterium]
MSSDPEPNLPGSIADNKNADSSTTYTGISELLDSLCNNGDPEEVLTLGKLLANLRERGFGMFLFISVLPGFIPVPGAAGIIAGPLSIFIGLQLIFGLKLPWVPSFIARRGPKRSTLARFRKRIAPWLKRLEHITRPRIHMLQRSRLTTIYTGILIILLGSLFALPIPFTNFWFAGLLLLFAFTLMERDGALMLVAWALSTITVVGFALLSNELSELINHWLNKLR